MSGAVNLASPARSISRCAITGGVGTGKTEELIRRVAALLENGEAPCAVAMALDGMEQNEDGLYVYDDLRGRIEDAIGEYYQIRATYAEDSGSDEGTVDIAVEEEELPTAA